MTDTKLPVGRRRYNAAYIIAEPVATGALQYRLNEAGLALVETMSAEGNALETISKALGISPSTFVELRKRQPEAQEAVRTGEAFLRDELVSTLLKQAREGNTTAAIFLAKARTHMRDVGPADPTNSAGPVVNINITSPMTDEQFAKMVTVNPPNATEDDTP